MVHFTVLINGTPLGHFESTRGIHQGDPLSPMLLVLVGEAHTRLVLKAQDLCLLQGFKVKESSSPIPLLRYADDILVMVDAIEGLG